MGCRGSKYPGGRRDGRPHGVHRNGTLLLTAALLSSCASGPDPRLGMTYDVPSQELTVEVAERLLVIAPHPDDETLAAAGLSQRVLQRVGSVRTLVLTGGEAMLSAVATR